MLLILKQANRNRGIRSTKNKPIFYTIPSENVENDPRKFFTRFSSNQGSLSLSRQRWWKGKKQVWKNFPRALLALSLFTKTVRKPFCIQPTWHTIQFRHSCKNVSCDNILLFFSFISFISFFRIWRNSEIGLKIKDVWLEWLVWRFV